MCASMTEKVKSSILYSVVRKCATNEAWDICWMVKLGTHFGQLSYCYLSCVLNGAGVLWKTEFVVVLF